MKLLRPLNSIYWKHEKKARLILETPGKSLLSQPCTTTNPKAQDTAVQLGREEDRAISQIFIQQGQY